MQVAKSQYKDWVSAEGCEKVRRWARAGWTDKEIAAQIGVSRKTLYDWVKKYPAFGDAMKAGQGYSNEEVKGSLYRKCLGYTVDVKKTFKVRKVEYDETTGKKIFEHEELVEGVDQVHVPADTAAIKFWLTNRQSDEWKNRVEGDAGGNGESLEAFLARMMGGGQ